MPQFQNNDQLNKENSNSRSSRISLGVHSMPKTNEKSFKAWFIISGVVVVVIIAIFLLLVI